MNPFNILGELLQHLLSFIPRFRVVPAWQGGVLFVRGSRVKEFKSGLVWYWPLWTVPLTAPVNRQVLSLEPETVTTKDGKACIIAGVITYQVTDVVKYLVENYDADESISEVASACLREVVVDQPLSEIQKNNRKKIDNALTKECKELLEGFGVEVERVRITSFAEAKVVNVIGTGLGVVPTEDEDEEE